jgi:hypothetical protein
MVAMKWNPQFLPIMSIVGLCLNVVQCADIVFLHGISSHSHRVTLWPLAAKLASEGHKITYVSPLPPKDLTNSNVTEVLPTRMAKANAKFVLNFDMQSRLDGKVGGWMGSAFQMGYELCAEFLKSEETKNWLATNPKIDLIIIDSCYTECYLGLAHRFNAPVIYYAPIITERLLDSFGVSYETSSIPEFRYHFRTPLHFIGRITGTLNQLLWRFYRNRYLSELDHLIRTEMNMPDMPNLLEIEKTVSLIFTNGYFVEDYPRSLPPLFVNVAGMHCKEKVKQLPEVYFYFLLLFKNKLQY